MPRKSRAKQPKLADFTHNKTHTTFAEAVSGKSTTRSKVKLDTNIEEGSCLHAISPMNQLQSSTVYTLRGSSNTPMPTISTPISSHLDNDFPDRLSTPQSSVTSDFPITTSLSSETNNDSQEYLAATSTLRDMKSKTDSIYTLLTQIIIDEHTTLGIAAQSNLQQIKQITHDLSTQFTSLLHPTMNSLEASIHGLILQRNRKLVLSPAKIKSNKSSQTKVKESLSGRSISPTTTSELNSHLTQINILATHQLNEIRTKLDNLPSSEDLNSLQKEPETKCRDLLAQGSQVIFQFSKDLYSHQNELDKKFKELQAQGSRSEEYLQECNSKLASLPQQPDTGPLKKAIEDNKQSIENLGNQLVQILSPITKLLRANIAKMNDLEHSTTLSSLDIGKQISNLQDLNSSFHEFIQTNISNYDRLSKPSELTYEQQVFSSPTALSDSLCEKDQHSSITHTPGNRNSQSNQTWFQSAIILDIPEDTSLEQIATALSTQYNITPDNFKILKSIKKHTTNKLNCLIAVVPRLLRKIIRKGGVLLENTSYLVRPFTKIKRCHKCQMLGHHKNNCVNGIFCANCGSHHETEGCNRASRCINCSDINLKYSTHYNLHHKASDINCPTYRNTYKEERRRLNAQYFHNHNIQTYGNYPPYNSSRILPSSQLQNFPHLPPIVHCHPHWNSAESGHHFAYP